MLNSSKPHAPTQPHEAGEQSSGVMPFGKFKGSKLDQLPDDYILWLSMLDLRNPLLKNVLNELARRLAKKDRRVEPEVVGQ
jgi:uncharacterized protein (DUF3820 family)